MATLDCEQLKAYVKSDFEETKYYLHRELEVLEVVKDYPVVSELLEQLPKRIRQFIKNKVESEGELNKYPKGKREQFKKMRAAYLTMISRELERLSVLYSWSDGCFGEAVGETLQKLSKELKPNLEGIVLEDIGINNN